MIEMENYTEKTRKREGSLIGMIRLRKRAVIEQKKRRKNKDLQVKSEEEKATARNIINEEGRVSEDESRRTEIKNETVRIEEKENREWKTEKQKFS